MNIPVRRQQEIMRLLIQKGYEAASAGNSPFSAALVDYKGEVFYITNNNEYTAHTTTTVELNVLLAMSEKFGMRSLANFALFTNAAPFAGGMIYMLKAGIRHFYYGAPPEDDAKFQPLIDEIVSHMPDKVYVTSGILEHECLEQIKRGRFIQREILLNQ